MIEVWRTFTFDSAHYLPKVPDGHKCARLHGHTYTVEVRLTGDIDPVTGWVQDFADIAGAFRPLNDELDHHLLNDVPGLDNPTSEHLACWIYQRLKPALPELISVAVSETRATGVLYRGEA